MITITAKPKAAFPVELVGVEYQIRPPKSALALKLGVRSKTMGDDPTLMLETLDEWIVAAFGKKLAAAVKKRIEDPEDALDIDHIMELMEKLAEESTGDPTT